MESTISVLRDVIMQVYEIERDEGKTGIKLANMTVLINNFIKYNNKSGKYSTICEPGKNKLASIVTKHSILDTFGDELYVIPFAPKSKSKLSNIKPKEYQSSSSSYTENIVSDVHHSTLEELREPCNYRNDQYKSVSNVSHSDRSSDVHSSSRNASARICNNEYSTDYLNKAMDLRKQVKQWLFGLIRNHKYEKDCGIRHQKLNLICKERWGYNSFKELCTSTQIGCYKSVEDFILHCGAPQIKMTKHKTTGKGKTKSSEWVFQEHDKYEGYSEEDTIPEPYVLPLLGLDVPLPLVDSTSEFERFEEDNTTRSHCERNSELRIKITNVLESPVFDCFQIRLEQDEKKYYQPMFEMLTEFYGPDGPSEINVNYQKYKMQAGSLRAGLPVVVWLPKYNEWVRCLTVTPSANKKDFTCQLVDFGHRTNSTVINCCYMHEQFTRYPFLSRECKLHGVRPVFGKLVLQHSSVLITYPSDSYSEDAYQRALKFYFGPSADVDNPGQNIMLQVNFLSIRDERAYVQIIDKNRPDEDDNEPVTIQNHLKKMNYVQLDQEYLRLNDGNSIDDSVSQNIPSRRKRAQIRQEQVYRPHVEVQVKEFVFPRRNANFDGYYNGISAKEKTGVDPLSQVKGSFEHPEKFSLKSSFIPENDCKIPNTKSWTGQRSVPHTSVGPAEALTRGTLNPPAQVSAARRQHR